MEADAVVERAEAVVAERVLHDTVVFDPESDTYARLNRTASRLWELLERPRSVAELTESLASSGGVTYDRAAADIEVFLRELERRGLVTVQPRAAAG